MAALRRENKFLLRIDSQRQALMLGHFGILVSKFSSLELSGILAHAAELVVAASAQTTRVNDSCGM